MSRRPRRPETPKAAAPCCMPALNIGTSMLKVNISSDAEVERQGYTWPPRESAAAAAVMEYDRTDNRLTFDVRGMRFPRPYSDVQDMFIDTDWYEDRLAEIVNTMWNGVCNAAFAGFVYGEGYDEGTLRDVQAYMYPYMDQNEVDKLTEELRMKWWAASEKGASIGLMFNPVLFLFFAGVSLYDFVDIYFPMTVQVQNPYHRTVALSQYIHFNGEYGKLIGGPERQEFLSDMQRGRERQGDPDHPEDPYKRLLEHIG